MYYRCIYGGNEDMKRTALAVTLVLSLLFSLEAGLLVVHEAKANPFIIFEATDPIPGTVPPIITVFCPQNNTVYHSGTVLLSFNVSKPQPPTSLDSGINFVRYILDGNYTALYFLNHYSSGSPPGLLTFNCSENLTLPEGCHTLVIEANGVVLPGNMTIFGMSSSSTISFTVDTAINSEQSIPEFPSILILPLFLTATLVAIVIRKRFAKSLSR
jgi:hypothetical protein